MISSMICIKIMLPAYYIYYNIINNNNSIVLWFRHLLTVRRIKPDPPSIVPLSSTIQLILSFNHCSLYSSCYHGQFVFYSSSPSSFSSSSLSAGVLLFIGFSQFAVGMMEHLQKMLHAIPDRWHEHFRLEDGSLVLHVQHNRLKTGAGAGIVAAGNETGKRVLVAWSDSHP
jgi:hypothetical protein